MRIDKDMHERALHKIERTGLFFFHDSSLESACALKAMRCQRLCYSTQWCGRARPYIFQNNDLRSVFRTECQKIPLGRQPRVCQHLAIVGINQQSTYLALQTPSSKWYTSVDVRHGRSSKPPNPSTTKSKAFEVFYRCLNAEVYWR